MKEEKKILIVEDDTDINNLLFTALKKQGYTATQAFSGTEAKMLLKMENFALVLLDLMLPGISGEEVLEFIKEQGNSAVIILTAKDTLDDKVNLLIAGADDYITKPFEIQEVLARVQVQLLRSVQEGNSNVLSHKQMVLDREKFQIKVEGQLMGKITKQEFSILELFLKHPKQVFSKEDIFEYAWEEPYMGETKTLDVHISNIRKKIKEVTKEEYIETVWGIGYRLQQ